MDNLAERAVQMLNAKADDKDRLKSMSPAELLGELMRASRFYYFAQSIGVGVQALPRHYPGCQEDIVAVIAGSEGLISAAHSYFTTIVRELGRREGLTVPELIQMEEEVYLEDEF